MLFLESLSQDNSEPQEPARRKWNFARFQNLGFAVGALAVMGAGCWLLNWQGGTTFVVNSTADAKDACPGDGVCDTGMSQCTLRAALEEVNTRAHFGTDRITFAIPGKSVHRIQPLSPLPTLKQAVIIDGTSQPGARPNTNAKGTLNARLLIELNGEKAGPGTGLRFMPGSEGSVVRGLVINGFDTYSSSGLGVLAEHITVAGCYIGTDPLGKMRQPNSVGVNIGMPTGVTPLSDNTVGGDNPADRNLIAGNLQKEVLLSDQARGTDIENNVLVPLTPLAPAPTHITATPQRTQV